MRNAVGDNIPGPDQVSCGEQGTKDNADTSDHDVCNAEERIAATHDGASTQEDGFCAVIDVDREVWNLVSKRQEMLGRHY